MDIIIIQPFKNNNSVMTGSGCCPVPDRNILSMILEYNNICQGENHSQNTDGIEPHYNTFKEGKLNNFI